MVKGLAWMCKGCERCKRCFQRQIENPDTVIHAAIDTIDDTLAERRDGLDHLTTRMVDAERNAEEKVGQNLMAAARHQLNLKLIHEKDAEDLMNEIIELQELKSSLQAADRRRKLRKTSNVVKNAREYLPKPNHVARETAAATQAANERKVEDQLNQIVANRRPGN